MTLAPLRVYLEFFPPFDFCGLVVGHKGRTAMSEPSKGDWDMADRTRSKRALAHDVEPPLAKIIQFCREHDLRGAHYVDVVVRNAGRDEHYEADWLKNLSSVILNSLEE